jgi:GAF domain-containing protein
MNHQAKTVEQYRERIAELEHELDEMTVALTHAWDQLVPFLQEAPRQAGSAQNLAPIIHAVMAASDTAYGGIYLFQDDVWSGIPDTRVLPADLCAQLKAEALSDKPVYFLNESGKTDGDLHWLFAPVTADNQVVGAIGIGNRETEHTFNAADHRILSRMAERVAGQIVAAQLARSHEREAAVRREMQIASMIQDSTQPTSPPRIPGVEVASFWQPARQVGAGSSLPAYCHSAGTARRLKPGQSVENH